MTPGVDTGEIKRVRKARDAASRSQGQLTREPLSHVNALPGSQARWRRARYSPPPSSSRQTTSIFHPF